MRYETDPRSAVLAVVSKRRGHVSEFADKVALPSVSTCLIVMPYSDMLV